MEDSDLKGSLGEFLLKAMRRDSSDKIVQIDSITGQKLTARQVLELSTKLAAGIKKLGLIPGDLVVILATFCTNSTVATLGCFLQGVVAFPLDPSLKQLELTQMFKKAQPKLVFLESKSAVAACKALSALGIDALVYLLDDEHVEANIGMNIRNFDDILEKVHPDAFQCGSVEKPEDQIALVIPSSGTTGLSKGVALTHKCCLFVLNTCGKVPEVQKKSDLLSVTPLFWISGMQLMLMSISFGLLRIFTSKPIPRNVLHAIETYKPKWTMLSPIYAAWLFQDPEFDRYDLSSVEKIMIGGAVVPPSTFKNFEERWPGVRLYQLYGTSEMGGLVTKIFCEGDKYAAGQLEDHVELKVVDPITGEDLGRNKPGEIVMRSAHTMMKCYLNDEESTKEAIDSNNFFHSGDVGYINDDNFIYITGRIKEMMKVRNHQVSPYEIEEVIMAMPGVRDVAVVGVPHEIDLYHPRALVVKFSGSNITEDAVITEVAEKLSETKQLVGGVQFVETIPRSPNGKIRRTGLLQLVEIKKNAD